MRHLTHLIEGDGGVVELVQVRVAGLVDVRPRRRLDLKENGIGFSATFGREDREENSGCCQLDRRYFEKTDTKTMRGIGDVRNGRLWRQFSPGS